MHYCFTSYAYILAFFEDEVKGFKGQKHPCMGDKMALLRAILLLTAQKAYGLY